MATIIGTDSAEALQATLADPMVIALSGNDTALGSTGDDNINGNQGDDLIFGGTGNDSLRGGQGNDQILGEDGQDTLWGDKGNDNIWGGNGNDQILGNVGTDFINGNQGNDTLWGGEDNDTVRGGQGNDSILGDNGNDSLYGDKGADTLAGGAGSDNFVIGNGTGGSNLADADWFSDYTDGTDRITLLDGLNFANLTVAQGTGANANNTTIRNTSTGEWLAVVAGVNATNITASDFGEAEPTATTTPTPQGTNTLPAFPPPELAVIPAVPPAAPPPPPPPPVATIAAGTTPTEAGPTNGTFTVTLDTAPTADVTIGYSFNGSTATGGGIDYSDPGNGSLTIAAGSTTGTITANIVNDTLLDPDETIVATLSAGTGYTVGTTNTATLTITDDEVPTITVAPVVGAAEQIAPGSGTVVPGEFVFTRTGTPTQIAAALTGVGFTVGGTATSGTDYTSIGTTVDFAAGSAQATVTVTPIDDNDVEGGETVTVTLNSPPVTGFNVGGTGTASLSIADDDVPSIVIQASQPNAEEWNTGTGAVVPGQYTLTRTGSAAAIAAALPVSVAFSGTATGGGTDYSIGVDPSSPAGTVYGPGVVTFGAGQTTAVLAVTPVRDINGAEGIETAIATIAPPAGYTVDGATATATVNIADEPLTITVAAGTQPAENGPVNGTFILTRTGATTSALNATYTFDAASTATGGGTDYTDIGGGTATFGVGQNTTTIELQTIDDTTPEVGETIILNSVTATGYTVTGTPATLTIVDDDVPTVTVTATDPTAGENAGETGTFTFTGAATTVVNYTVSGTATATTDYTALAGTITLTGNPATDILTVTAVDDAIASEGSETVIVTIDASTATPPAYNIGGTGTATVSIVDNDGTTGDDNLVGSTGADIMSGGDGNDTLTGGASADNLTGGNGTDSFRYNATTEGTDTIADFTAGTDKILVSQATFGGLSAGTLAAANFVSGTAATAAVPQFLYDSTTGNLSFDIDGTGATAAVTLATLTGTPALTNTDIEVF